MLLFTPPLTLKTRVANGKGLRVGFLRSFAFAEVAVGLSGKGKRRSEVNLVAQ
jgi:hypothetical protein